MEKQTKDKKFGPNPVLVLLVLAFVALAMWMTRKRDKSDDRRQEDAKADHGESVSPADLSRLGKTVGIGASALAVKADGTEVVGVDVVQGLSGLLEGRDVDAVSAALENAGVRHVLVDPSIAKFNPLPLNTVKNRLALGRPAGRLTATWMSKQLFLYNLGDPPLDLPKTAKEALTKIARSAFGGGSGEVPSGAPDIVTKKGDWKAILTVRPVQAQHISYHSVSADNLADAARKAGLKARRYYLKRDSFEDLYGPLDQALKDKLTVELEVLYDEGTFTGPRDDLFLWRIIEPGIDGIKMKIDKQAYYLPPWYSVVNNYATVSSLFERICKDLAGKDKDLWKSSDVAFERFRTVHWRERSPGGEIEDLYRASPRVPSMKDVTRDNLIASLKGLADWIADNQTSPDGRYLYRYFPTKDEESDEYNIVRHALGPFSMALAQQYAPNPKYKEKAEAGMKFLESHIRWGGAPRRDDGTIDDKLKTWMGKPLPGDDVAIIEFAEPPEGKWANKMGGVAVAILGYTQFKRVGWKLGAEHEKVLKGLANFLLYMQKEDGSFHHYYVSPENGYYGTRNSIYPGEILYAVARLYGETKDERFRTVFKQSMDTELKWFKEQMAQRLADGTYEEEHRKNLVQFQPWIAMAMDEMYRYDPDPSYLEASNLVSFWIMDEFQFDETRAFFPDYLGGYFKVLNELPAMHTFVYTEGTAASFDLARRAGADVKTIEKLRKGALLSARFLMQQQVRPGENDYYYSNPKKAKGAVRYCLNHNKQRIDYTYHALSSVYRILSAATDDDYLFAQSIEMPSRW